MTDCIAEYLCVYRPYLIYMYNVMYIVQGFVLWGKARGNHLGSPQSGHHVASLIIALLCKPLVDGTWGRGIPGGIPKYQRSDVDMHLDHVTEN